MAVLWLSFWACFTDVDVQSICTRLVYSGSSCHSSESDIQYRSKSLPTICRMKLISVDASPFVRKVRILVLELGLQDSVELVDPGPVTPVSNNVTLNAINPLGMLPALELDSGESLYDSPVICEYLNQIADGQFFPTDSTLRFKTLGLQALGDGILDLSLKFKTAEIVAALGPAENRTCQVLQLDGNLSPAWEDRPITGSDSVLLLGPSYQETADAEASR